MNGVNQMIESKGRKVTFTQPNGDEVTIQIINVKPVPNTNAVDDKSETINAEREITKNSEC